jgi:hypothetical protein
MSDATVSGRHPADWQDLRHVPGLGQGYLGIWDRESPDEPIAVFMVSRRGESRLREELERLQPGTGASRGRHDRFGWIDGSAPIAGERRAAAVFEGEEVVGVVVAAEHGHGARLGTLPGRRRAPPIRAKVRDARDDARARLGEVEPSE